VPIPKDEFNRGIKLSDFQRRVQAYLDEKPGNAFNLSEIANAMGFPCINEETPVLDVLRRAGVILAFQNDLESLVKTKRIQTRTVKGERYYSSLQGASGETR